MVSVTQGQTFASPVDRAAFLQTPVGFCSGMSVLALIELGYSWQLCTNTPI